MITCLFISYFIYLRYNIFFYSDHGRMRAKIMPRFPTSPLFIGYNIHFRPNNLEAIAADVKQIYFKEK